MGKWADLYREKFGHGIDEEPASDAASQEDIDPAAMERVKKRLSSRILRSRFKLEKGREMTETEQQIIDAGGANMGPEDLRQHSDLLTWLGASQEDIDKDLEARGSYKLEKTGRGPGGAVGAAEDRGITGMLEDELSRVGGIVAKPFRELFAGHPLNALKEAALIPAETLTGIGDERDLLDTERGVLKEGASRLLGALKEGHVAGSLKLYTPNVGDYAKEFGPAFWEQLTRGGDKAGEEFKSAYKSQGGSGKVATAVEIFADPLNLPFGAVAGKVAKSLGLIQKVSRTGIESKLANNIGEGLAKTLGTSQEQWAAHLKDAGKAEAVREAIIKGATDTAQWQQSYLDNVGRIFTKQGVLDALEKIPFVGKSGAISIARTLRSIPLIGKKFGVGREEQASIFRTIEGIKEFDAAGNPVFGAEMRTGSGQLRRSVADTQREWLSLSPDAKRATRWWVTQQPVEKAMFGISSDIEGYIHHFEDSGILSSFRNIFLKNKKASAEMFRSDTGEFVEHAERAIMKGGAEIRGTRVYNRMIGDIAKNVSEAIPPSGIPKGYVEIPSLQSTRTGSAVGQLGGGRMMKAELWDQLVRHEEAYKGMNQAQLMMRGLGNFYKSNILNAPGTAVTNAIGGGLQYAAKALNNTFRMMMTGDFKPVLADIAAPFETLAQAWRGGARSTSLWGGKSALYSEMGRGSNPLMRLQSAMLTPFEAVENFWKRTLINSELRAKGLSAMTDRAIAGNKQLLGDLNRIVDRYAFNYDNVPNWLKKARESSWGWAVMPFPTYGYKLARYYSHFGAALNPFIQMAPVERIARLATLGTLGGLGYHMAAGNERKHIEGMTSQVDTTGRSMIGTKDGKEQWLRTVKYPWFNLGQVVGSSEDESGLGNVADEFITFGPLIEGIKVAAGWGDRWEAHIPTGVRVGNIVAGFIPGTRLTQGSKAMEGGKRILPTTFDEAVLNAIPFTGMQGKVQIDRITKKPVMLNPNIEAMKFWLGLSMKEIDPRRYTMERGRKLRAALAALADAKDESELNRAVDRLAAVDKERLAKLADQIKRRRLSLRGDEGRMMQAIMDRDARNTQKAIAPTIEAGR